MMRRWLRLLLAAAAAAKRTVNMAGVVEVDAWMHHRAPPPRRWDATDPAALDAKWTKLSSGFYKEVHRAALGGDDVVVKRRKLYKADRKRAGGAALRGEALYHEREVRGEVLYALGAADGPARTARLVATDSQGDFADEASSASDEEVAAPAPAPARKSLGIPVTRVL